MAENELMLKKGTRVFIGNACFTLHEDAVGAFESLTTRDAVAEALAANSQVVYGEHREQLAHIIERDGARIGVSYGLHGARVESEAGDVPAGAESEGQQG